MTIMLQSNDTYVLRFDKGEEVIAGLVAFAKENELTAGVFNAIGACSEVTLAFYDLENKKYLDHTISEDHEIVSVTGNISRMDENPIIHAHGVFSDRNMTTRGGHIKAITVSATCEVTITELIGNLTREFDEETGLNLLR